MPWPTPTVSIHHRAETPGELTKGPAAKPPLAARVLASLRPDPTNPTMGLFQPPPWSTAPFTPPSPPDRSPDAALVWRILPACASRHNDSIALCDLSRAEICSGLHSCSWQLVARASSSTRSSSDIRAKAL